MASVSELIKFADIILFCDKFSRCVSNCRRSGPSDYLDWQSRKPDDRSFRETHSNQRTVDTIIRNYDMTELCNKQTQILNT